MFGLHWSAFLMIFILWPIFISFSIIYGLTYKKEEDTKWRVL